MRGDKMPRKARTKSSTGIYHILIRGINRQIIFEDDEDYQQYLEVLKEQKEKSGIEIYAYCLMSNHIHLLIKEGSEELGTVFKRIGASYVYWYNWKYNRRGHLYQDRFKSEEVQNDSYFLTVIKYIHQNPVKAGITKKLEQYPWCSYNEYVGEKGFCETQTAFKIFSDNPLRAVILFKEFSIGKVEDNVLDDDEKIRWKDNEASIFIKKLASVVSPTDIQNMGQESRDQIILACKQQGMSIRQIVRLTGVSFGVIRKL
jgi:REP element-mobilizing transposase RayT